MGLIIISARMTYSKGIMDSRSAVAEAMADKFRGNDSYDGEKRQICLRLAEADG